MWWWWRGDCGGGYRCGGWVLAAVAVVVIVVMVAVVVCVSCTFVCFVVWGTGRRLVGEVWRVRGGLRCWRLCARLWSW